MNEKLCPQCSTKMVKGEIQFQFGIWEGLICPNCKYNDSSLPIPR